MNFQLNDNTFKLSMTSLSQGYWGFRYKRVNENNQIKIKWSGMLVGSLPIQTSKQLSLIDRLIYQSEPNECIYEDQCFTERIYKQKRWRHSNAYRST